MAQGHLLIEPQAGCMDLVVYGDYPVIGAGLGRHPLVVGCIAGPYLSVRLAQIPKPHTPSGKKSVPAKVQFQYLLCQFRPPLISTI